MITMKCPECPEFCSDMEMFPICFSGKACCSISIERASVHRLSPYQVMQQLFAYSFLSMKAPQKEKKNSESSVSFFVPSPTSQEIKKDTLLSVVWAM